MKKKKVKKVGTSSSMKDSNKMTSNIPESVGHAWVLEFSLY
jgi:hypothetical protein